MAVLAPLEHLSRCSHRWKVPYRNHRTLVRGDSSVVRFWIFPTETKKTDCKSDLFPTKTGNARCARSSSLFVPFAVPFWTLTLKKEATSYVASFLPNPATLAALAPLVESLQSTFSRRCPVSDVSYGN